MLHSFKSLTAAVALLPAAVFAVLSTASCSLNPGVTVGDLRCENLYNPLAIDSTEPHFSWKIAAGDSCFMQRAYEIMAGTDSAALAADTADLWSSGKVLSGESVMVPYGGRPLEAPSLSFWKVRVWGENDGQPTPWSGIARFGVGILDNDKGWGSDFVGSEGEGAKIFRRFFEVDNPDRIHLLHINTLGYSEVYVNGRKVSEDVLSPSVSELDRRSLSVTYDITSFLQEGMNEVAVWLGRGWYRDTVYPEACPYPLFRARIDEMTRGEVRTVMEGADEWMCRESGYGDTPETTWQMRRFGGEKVDGALVPSDMKSNTLDKFIWDPVIGKSGVETEVSPRMDVPNRIMETVVPVGVEEISDSVRIYDMGKVFTGWADVRMTGLSKGDTVIFAYSDGAGWDGAGLDEVAGEFRPQDKTVGCYDMYIASGNDQEVFRNKFNHHAFRYVRVQGRPGTIQMKGLRISADLAPACTFECSDGDLNDIYGMIMRTFPNLAFSGYVVDCPHRERLGYGGDGNASRKSWQTFYDADPLYMNWLRMWADCIKEDGGMPHNVPNAYSAGGGPYWCGFIITASWEAYVNYGDDRMIRRYYPEMKRWLGYVDAYTRDGLLRPWPDTPYRTWYLGDWLAPNGVDYSAAESVDLVNNCFIYQCYGIMEKIARILAQDGEADGFHERKIALGQRINREFYHPETATYGTGTQIDMSYPLLCGLAGDASADVEAAMKDYTDSELGNHIGVGLVGVTVLTEWAIRTGNADFMASMLRQEDYPGYLYMIRNGATATWEYWSGEYSRVHNCYNGIGSWFIRALAGISADDDHPGFSTVNVAPQVASGIDWVKATKETPYGTVSIDWSLSEGQFCASVRIPANSTGSFTFPAGSTSCILDSEAVEEGACAITLTPGLHRLTALLP